MKGVRQKKEKTKHKQACIERQSGWIAVILTCFLWQEQLKHSEGISVTHLDPRCICTDCPGSYIHHCNSDPGIATNKMWRV